MASPDRNPRSFLKGGNYEDKTFADPHGRCVGMRAYLHLREPVRAGEQRPCAGRLPCVGLEPRPLGPDGTSATPPPTTQVGRGGCRPQLRWYWLLRLELRLLTARYQRGRGQQL